MLSRSNARRLILPVLLLAALLRAANLMQIEHNVDHAYPIWQALMTLEHGRFPLAGQATSVLFANPAGTGYLYLPLIALTRSPLGAYLLVIALNTLGVWLAYRATRLIFGEAAGLIAAALMAVNPWMIEYSRTSWVQSLLPFFVPLIAWLLWGVLLRRSRNPARRLLGAFVAFAIAAQTYLLVYALAAPVGVLCALFWRRIPKRALAAGIAIFAVLTLLYGLGLLDQQAAVEARIGNFSSSPPRLSSEALGHALRLISGRDYAAARGTLAPVQDADRRMAWSEIAHAALTAALIMGVVRAVRHIARRGEAKDGALIALIWFGLPIALMSYVGQVVHPFYQLIGLPAGHALAAWGLCALPDGLRRRSGVLAGRAVWGVLIALYVPFAALMAANSLRYYEETRAQPGAHGLGALPLDHGLVLGRAINNALPAGGSVFADVDEWTLSSFAGRTFPFLREARAPQFNIIPADGGIYVTAEPPALEPPFGGALASTLDLPDGARLRVYTFAAGAALPPDAAAYQVNGDHGMALAGYTLRDDVLIVYWRVTGRTAETDDTLFAPFAHLFDAAGTRVAIVDGAPVPGYAWRIGDLHAHRLVIPPLPEAAAPLSVSIGQYDGGRGMNVIFLLPDGTFSPLIPLPVTITAAPA